MKVDILYPSVHFVSSRTQTNSARECLARCACWFGNSPFVSSLLALAGSIPKKITFISPRVITLLVQRTSGEENYSSSEFFTRLGRLDDR